MKISKIHLKNFKFHHNMSFEINKVNCLIYGENGTGKSSIFWALYSTFEVYFRNESFDFSVFKNKYTDQELQVDIEIDKEIVLGIPNIDRSQLSLFGNNQSKTVYFLNQTILESIIKEKNFYITIESLLCRYFDTVSIYSTGYREVNQNLTSSNTEGQSRRKKEIDEQYDVYLKDIERETNGIIKSFGEDFLISFNFNSGLLNTNDLKFDKPNIEIAIDGIVDIEDFFNEAKLRLTSIAIFLAMIKRESGHLEENKLKLFVLDDFLTSLDMANRKYIVEYIFNEFAHYQKIILTHNLQFYNLIIDWLKVNHEIQKWDIKNIYTRQKEEEFESVIYSIDDDYLSQAKEKLGQNDLGACGNLIRKEFERLIHEIEKKEQIGDREETNRIVDSIISKKPVIYKQEELCSNIRSKLRHLDNLLYRYQENETSIRVKIQELKAIFENSDNIIAGSDTLRDILQKLVFYRKILLNRSSHDNPHSEVYRKEYTNAIKLIEKLRETV